MNHKILVRLTGFYLPLSFFLVLLVLFSLNLLGKTLFLSFIYSLVISFLNFIIGYFSINYGINKKDKTFLLIVFGAIIIRFFIVFFLIVIVLSFLDVRIDYFIFTTFILYFYYLIIEILYLKNLKSFEKIKE